MKQLIKNLLIPVLASRPVSSLAEKLVPDGVPIFIFHRFNSSEDAVSGHDPAYLNKCLSYLKHHDYNFVSIEQVVRSIRDRQPLPKRSIAFTIDDGFLDHATVAAPVFIQHHCPVTIFLISGMIDGELWPWDDQIAYMINNTSLPRINVKLDTHEEAFELGDAQLRKHATVVVQNILKTMDAAGIDEHLKTVASACEIDIPEKPPGNYKSMSWEMARQLEQQGVKFAPHSRSHRILSKLDDEGSRQEVYTSWQRLKQELNDPSPVFCYPTGRDCDFSQRDIDNIRDAGLIGAVSMIPTYVDPDNKDENYMFRLPRFGFPHSFHDFIQYSSWIERAK